MDADLGREHHQLAAGDQALHHLFAVRKLIGGEARIDLIQTRRFQPGLPIELQQLFLQGALPLGEMDGKLRQREPVPLRPQLVLPDELPQHRVADGLIGVLKELLPQLRHPHARMERVLPVILLQNAPAAFPAGVQHGGRQKPSGQRLRDLARRAEILQLPRQLLRLLMELGCQLLRRGQGQPLLRHRLQQLLVAGAVFLHGQRLQHPGIAALVLHGTVVQHHAAADGLQRRIKPHHEPVARPGGDLLRHAQLGIAALAGTQRVPIQQHHLAQTHGGAMEKMHLRAVEDGAAALPQVLQAHIQHQRSAHRAGAGDGIAPGQVALFHARQIDGHPLARIGRLHILAVDLQVPHPADRPAGQDLRPVAHRHRALDEGARDHGAEAVDGKDPVDGQPVRRPQALFCRAGHQRLQRRLQLRDALSRGGRHAKHRLALQKGPLDPLGNVLLHHVDPVRIRHVALGDDHHAVPDAQKLQNAQMLHRLRHEALVGGHHQHGQIDAASPRQHIADELFVAGDIHDARLRAVVKIQMGKAQLDGDAPLFFLQQTVGVDAGQSLDQHGLAVVHMARRADDHMLHFSASAAARAISSKSSSCRVRTSSRYRSLWMRPTTGSARRRIRASSPSTERAPVST